VNYCAGGAKTVELFRPDSTRLGGRKSGILPAQEIRELINNGKIRSPKPVSEDQIQPASIDLRLGAKAYRVIASFLPTKKSLIGPKIREILLDEIDLTAGAVLKPDNVYIAPVMEYLSLPADVSGVANPKSTTGRLDVFTRLMAEGQPQFEHVPRGYAGDLYVEIVPRSFPIIVSTGTKLNQLRFVRGDSDVEDEQLRKIAQKRPLVYDGNGGLPKKPTLDGGLWVDVDLAGTTDQTIVGYRAKKAPEPIDLAKVGAYTISDFWEALDAPSLRGSLVIRPGEFYLLASKTPVCVPPEYAAEMVAYDQSVGEFTVHYAGFFDPGFGCGMSGEIEGTRAVLEVRAHEIPMQLEDGRAVGRLEYHRMAERPTKIYGKDIGSSYQQQGLALSKQFKQILSAQVATGRDG
jgi:dCTP deaminase